VSCGYAPLRPEIAFCTNCGTRQPARETPPFADAEAPEAADAGTANLLPTDSEAELAGPNGREPGPDDGGPEVPEPSTASAPVTSARSNEPDDIEMTARSGLRGRMAATGSAATRYRIEFDDGHGVEVGEEGLLGRDPAADDDEDVVHKLSLQDPEHSVSKTHVKFGVDADGFWVADRHSVNGTVLVDADGTRTRLEPDSRTTVPTGAAVEFGNRRFTVSPVCAGSRKKQESAEGAPSLRKSTSAAGTAGSKQRASATSAASPRRRASTAQKGRSDRAT
jgi:hypothetical protein